MCVCVTQGKRMQENDIWAHSTLKCTHHTPSPHHTLQSVLPEPGAEEVCAAVNLLSAHHWPAQCVWHVISSMAASQCLHNASTRQLARYVHVCICSISDTSQLKVVVCILHVYILYTMTCWIWAIVCSIA